MKWAVSSVELGVCSFRKEPTSSASQQLEMEVSSLDPKMAK
jgi:hypothetical protein